MADLTTPSSSRSTQFEHKWTVSPEFGHALLTAMRERSNTGGPLPRLPSMLQLPSPELPTTPTLSSPTKSDSTERLKMKTRVAIRDRDPHRFQVVPLRDADKYSVNQKLSRGQPMESVPIRGTGATRANLYSKKGYVDENDSAPLVSVLQDRRFNTDTPERLAILSERNKNILAQGLSSSEIPVALDNHATNARFDTRTIVEQSKKPSKQCSNPSAKTTPNQHKLHLKSPSLGNLRSKPSLDVDLKANPLPRVTSCRKRTNTLSADHKHRPYTVISTEPTQRPDRRNLVVKKDSVRRHAIYTQSLCVPALERPNLALDETSTQLSDESSPLRAFPSRTSIPVNPKKFNTFPAAHAGKALAGNALGFIDMPSSNLGIQRGNLNSQSSILPIYSQNEPTHASTSDLDPSRRHHHPIVLELLVEIEKTMQEWSTI